MFTITEMSVPKKKKKSRTRIRKQKRVQKYKPIANISIYPEPFYLFARAPNNVFGIHAAAIKMKTESKKKNKKIYQMKKLKIKKKDTRWQKSEWKAKRLEIKWEWNGELLRRGVVRVNQRPPEPDVLSRGRARERVEEEEKATAEQRGDANERKPLWKPVARKTKTKNEKNKMRPRIPWQDEMKVRVAEGKQERC